MDRGEQPSTRWIESVLGIRVASSEVLVGGMSSDVRRLVLADETSIVVRRPLDRAWLERDPDLIRREARALDILATSEVPAPQLVAQDPAAGLLAMSAMSGVVHTASAQLASRTDALAELAATIARVDLPKDHGLPTWRSWAPKNPVPPAWGDRGLWAECIAAYTGAAPPEPDTVVLLHRDLHPLNVLWSGSVVTGVVDWVNACIGHPHAELGHCRWNLSVLVDVAAADDFRSSYLERTGTGPSDPWWDLAAVVGLLPGPIGTSGWNDVGRTDLTSEIVRTATEVFIRSVLDAP